MPILSRLGGMSLAIVLTCAFLLALNHCGNWLLGE